MICFQELFYGPYFGTVQDARYYEYAESVPGPTVERFASLAQELGIVVVLPVYEEEAPGVLYNTAAVVDADGRYLGKYRKTHIPQLPKFWEKFYFRPGNLAGRCSRPPPGRSASTSATTGTSRRAGACSASPAPRSSSTRRRPPPSSKRLWELEQPASAVANGYFIGANNRIGRESDEFGEDAVTFYGSSYFVGPDGNYVGDVASTDQSEVVVRDLDLDEVRRVRESWQFYRDRRPDQYDAITAP